MVTGSFIHAFRSMSLAHRMRTFLPTLPLVLLLIGMSTVFFFVSNRGLFYRNTWNPSSHFQWVSSQHLTIAVNLSLSHHLLGFESQSVDAEGNITYSNLYNRFPPGGYILIKLVTLLFGDDLSNRIYAAQVLMLSFFIGASILAYWSLCRLTSNRWVASSVTLMVFSSTQFLLFNDMILTELMPDLFGFVLTFHGIVIFLQESRFRQLLIKAGLAILLGWHVLALLLMFIVLSLIKEVRIQRIRTVRNFFISLVASRYFVLGSVALGLGVLILMYNIGNEYYALNIRGVRQLALSDLPSFRSMLYRTGLSQELDSGKALDVQFFGSQLTRIGLMSVPFIGSGLYGTYLAKNWQIVESQNLIIGILVIVVCMVGVLLVRYKLLAMTAILAGFCWSIPMYRNTIQHEYDAVFYVGVLLFFYTLILLLIRKWLNECLMPLTSFAALMVFIFSSHRMGYTDRDDLAVEFHETIVEDFDVIRGITRGRNTLVPIRDTEAETIEFLEVRYGIHYYLSGEVIMFNNFECDHSLDRADFIVQTRRDKTLGLLTPDNQMIFLYDRYIYEERIDRLEETEPVVRDDFDIYFTDDRELVYISDRCGENNSESLLWGSPIRLRIYPVNAEDIPDSELDHELVSLYFTEYSVMDTKRYVMIFDLPHYDIASISIEQYTDEGGIWNWRFFGPEYVVDDYLSQRVDQIIASREPIISDEFDVYLTDDRSLVYVREPCYAGNIIDDFFVHIVPANVKDLPEHRRQYEFDNLDFIFFDRGIKDGKKCAAVIKLPDYDIVKIRTGQYKDEGPIWQSESNNVK